MTTPSSPSVFRPPTVATPTTTRTSTADQKTRSTRPGRGPETVGARATNGSKQRLDAIVVAVANDAGIDARQLLLGALGLLALALASGSLLFFVARTSGWEART